MLKKHMFKIFLASFREISFFRQVQEFFSYKKMSNDLSSDEEKNKKQEYGCKKYKNLPEDKKQRLVEYKIVWQNKITSQII